MKSIFGILAIFVLFGTGLGCAHEPVFQRNYMKSFAERAENDPYYRPISDLGKDQKWLKARPIDDILEIEIVDLPKK